MSIGTSKFFLFRLLKSLGYFYGMIRTWSYFFQYPSPFICRWFSFFITYEHCVNAFPSIHVVPGRSPLNFDSFSVALVFCQLLFNLLDERTDAAFHQQLEVAKYDLDSWLERELSSTLRPVSVFEFILYVQTGHFVSVSWVESDWDRLRSSSPLKMLINFSRHAVFVKSSQDGLDDALIYLGERAGKFLCRMIPPDFLRLAWKLTNSPHHPFIANNYLYSIRPLESFAGHVSSKSRKTCIFRDRFKTIQENSI